MRGRCTCGMVQAMADRSHEPVRLLIAYDGSDEAAGAIESASGPWRALVATARAETASVIVAGSRGRGALASTVLGSVASGLVHNAELPTLVVRGT